MISVVGGLVLLVGTVVLFNPPNSTSTNRAAKQNASSSDEATAPSSLDTTPGPSATASATPTGTPAPQRTYSAAPPFSIDPAATYIATIATDQGNIVLQLDAKAAPQTVNNFVFLATNRFYDGLAFQRVIKDFVAQGGAPQPDGSGGPGYVVPPENSPLKHTTGALAVAEALGQPGMGSTFYVVLKDQPDLDGKDTVFGKVTSGLEILQNLPNRDPKDPNAPAPLMMKSITVSKQ
ncbi:MAG TPA: peptidylprolyl isomerase [Dehalococcoidia bacterium]|nr:peptidylprolyl isomerase [Dehalococcoidia bacterium]